ncbi:MAG: aminomethyl-transferring glycine dehydrogenase subunit GcvPA [Bacillota bacterium]|nr:aminomethyl-transferring glycine dehydrogenase subunit GcvPA [Bacillota bacterium]
MNFRPQTEADRKAMLEAIGLSAVQELFAGLPQEVLLDRPLDLPGPLSELELDRHLRELAARNQSARDYPCFLGAGAYDHFIPAVVRYVLARSEFYTAYTPYQAEISQGMLQAIYEYQSLICLLTGLEVANASLYDGATAVAEAALMAVAATGRSEVLVAEGVHPEYRQVLGTYARPRGVAVRTLPRQGGLLAPEDLRKALGPQTAAVIVQTPNFFGLLEDAPALGEVVAGSGALFVVCTNPISLGLLAPPGEYGADIAVGEGQPLGNPLGFGGPHLGFMACREKLVRRLPGRIVGATTDGRGRRGFVLTLQAREQHIRREKATSNICSNQALNALAAAVYLAALGPEGLREVAELCVQKAHYAQRVIEERAGLKPTFAGPFFHEFAVRCPADPEVVNRRLRERGLGGGVALGRWYPDLTSSLLFCCTEKRTRQEIDRLAEALGECQA